MIRLFFLFLQLGQDGVLTLIVGSVADSDVQMIGFMNQ